MSSSPEYIVRPAQPGDATAISAIVTGWAHHYLADPLAQEAAPFLASLMPAPTAERIAAPDFLYYVAQDASGVCGMIAVRDSQRIHHLFIRQDASGRGIARALWEHAKARSGAVQFFVNAALPAIPVYARFGFVATGGQQWRHGLSFVPMCYGGDTPAHIP